MNPTSLLRVNGLRVTPGRLALLQALARARTPLRASELITRCKTSLDRVTTYRTLEQFVEKQLVRAIHVEGATRYELRDEHDHHHVTCLSCKKTQDVEVCGMNHLTAAIEHAADQFAQITDHTFEIFGVCKGCAKKNIARLTDT